MVVQIVLSSINDETESDNFSSYNNESTEYEFPFLKTKY